MSARRSHSESLSTGNLGLILIDYDNLFALLAERTTKEDEPHRFLVAMLGELRRYLTDELGIRPARTIAYGDFSSHTVEAGVIFSDLATAGVEARHIPSEIQADDSQTSLTIHATELLHSRSDLSAFIILSGNHWYTPLVQHLQRFGKFVLVAALDLPDNLGTLWSDVSDAFLNAHFLLDSRTRDGLADTGQRPESTATAQDAQERAPEETTVVDEPGAIHALEVIEENFGQYEEVYLTPLLRKLTESLDSEDGEPKELVNLLQECGAVWLEKRRGFPYDYTVLLVNAEHPDVARIREEFAAVEEDFDDGDDEDDEEYETEDFDDDDTDDDDDDDDDYDSDEFDDDPEDEAPRGN